MRIQTYLNTTKEEVEAKRHNIWIGVSLGNRYFTKANIRKYIEWALKNTKDDVLVAIIDDIHAINFEVFDKRSKDSSLRRARRKGDVKAVEIQEIIRELPEKDKPRVHIARWTDLINSKYHSYRQRILFDEFESNKEFRDYVIDVIREGRSDRVAELNPEELNYLAEYTLREIPIFINGAKYKTRKGWKTYSLIVYPGLTKLDKLFIGLQNRTMFPELADKLKITDKIAILEGYMD
jgi:tRNA-dependent cyclodipeptide synthase